MNEDNIPSDQLTVETNIKKACKAPDANHEKDEQLSYNLQCKNDIFKAS